MSLLIEWIKDCMKRQFLPKKANCMNEGKPRFLIVNPPVGPQALTIAFLSSTFLDKKEKKILLGLFWQR